MIALAAIMSGANPISAKRRPRADVDLATPRRHVRACRLLLVKARTATRFATPGDDAPHGRMLRPEMRVAVRSKKPATGFPARALKFLR